MLRLLALPIELLPIIVCALQAMLDAKRGRKRQRYGATILVNAPRELAWRLNVAERMVLNAPLHNELAIRSSGKGNRLAMLAPLAEESTAQFAPCALPG
ncbi:hypothetical protein ACRAVF_32390 [Bradyrhizobium oligotrophicum S58]